MEIDKNFKYKYKLQDYKNIRLIYFSDLVSNTNYWENFINKNFFNLVSVACHYSNVYKNSDSYIKAQEKTISEKILLLVDKNTDDILNMFIKTMLEKTSVETDNTTEIIKEPEMFEESDLEEDFEIPAFLRKQKN